MTTSAEAARRSECRNRFFRALIVILAVLVAYHNGLNGPFIFDDPGSIRDNPTIRELWPPWKPLSPPRGNLTVSGRPLVNLSLAINYAIGGMAVRGYHVVNVAIHVVAALTLAGIARRTLLQPTLRARFGKDSAVLSTAIAVLWAVHPLQTESVTYVVQRAESLMGLFYLTTIYCFIRATQSQAVRWRVFAVISCLCGMATKEVMVSAPLMALLYDRTFVARTFREALRQRWRLHLGLAGCWLLLAWLLAGGGSLGSAGASFDGGLHWSLYALTQCRVIMLYLWLTAWPHPLVLDYGGRVVVGSVAQAMPFVLMIVALLAGTVVGLSRWPALGFAGCWFFGILAVTSSILPLNDTIFEHRMYLALAAPIALFVSGVHFWSSRRTLALLGAIAVVFIAMTVRRNRDYQSELAIWTDTIARRPDNARARRQLGVALCQHGRTAEGIVQFQTALATDSNYAEARHNLAHALYLNGRMDEAIEQYQEALVIDPEMELAHNNLALLLFKAGRPDEAIAHFESALAINSDCVDALNNLAWLLSTSPDPSRRNGRLAVTLAARAVDLTDGRDPAVLATAAAACAEAGRFDEAIGAVKRAIELSTASGAGRAARWIEQLRLYDRGQPVREEVRPEER